MIQMKRDNIGLFGWDGRGSFRDAAPRDQPGNRELRLYDGNRRIDGDMGWLVHGEILRHLRAIGACVGIRRGRGIPILFAGESFIHGDLQQMTTGRLEWIEEYHLVHFEGELKKGNLCDRKSQIQFVSTSHERTVRRHIGVMSSAQHQVAHRATNTREMLLLSAGKLFQDVGYVRASIQRIAAGVNAPKGTFYNYFGSKEELASILVVRQFAVIYQSLSVAPGESAYDRLKQHFYFLATEPPMIAIAPLQLLAIFAAEAPAIPPDIGQRIAGGIHVWDRQLGDLISRAHIEKGASVAQDSTKLALHLTTCCFGAIVRRKSDPSLKLVDDFLPSLFRCAGL
jgi:AcrR family transcriptional regulator